MDTTWEGITLADRLDERELQRRTRFTDAAKEMLKKLATRHLSVCPRMLVMRDCSNDRCRNLLAPD